MVSVDFGWGGRPRHGGDGGRPCIPYCTSTESNQRGMGSLLEIYTVLWCLLLLLQRFKYPVPMSGDWCTYHTVDWYFCS